MSGCGRGIGFFASLSIVVASLICLRLAKRIAVVCGGLAVIALGQAKEAHWAFEPVVDPSIPVSSSAWPSSPIDAFVLRELQTNGMSPSPPAKPGELIRRATIELTGLPPTFAEARAYQLEYNSDARQALAGLVDRLLTSPEYGRRWGRHWLDVARYADAKGYVDAGESKYPFAYTYRDYVVEAFNHDLPFNRFIREQIAADLLPGRTPESMAALGFLTVGARFNFFPHEIIDDRIDVVTRGFLGLTAACARCHDHKYDPIPIEDYYSLYGVFANSREPSPDRWPVIGAKAGTEDVAIQKKLTEAAGKYDALRDKLHRQIQHELRAWAGDYLRYIVQSTPRHRTQAQPEIRTERGVIREVAAYASGGVIRWRLFLESRQSDDPIFGMWRRLFELEKETIPAQFENEFRDWQKGSEANALVVEAFKSKPPKNMADVANVYGTFIESVETEWRQLQNANTDAAALADAAKEQVRRAMYAADFPATMTVDESADLYALDESTEVRKHFAAIERVYLEKWNSASPRPMLMADRRQPGEQRVFLRGDANRLGPRVGRHIPAVYTGNRVRPIERGSGRLALADSIASEDNPLTARVIVNRVWAWHFGRGLVETSSDFGVRSAPASHPELLDHLAAWFVRNEWSIKRLNRYIMHSKTWQQSSVDRPALRGMDPDNRLLWRKNRRRMGFETMRDSMLFVSGQLDHHAGGPPLEKAPDDTANRRRTLYSFVDRENLPDVFRVFDFPCPDISAPGRSRTTVPQQSLFLLNNPFVLARAEALAKRLANGTNEARVAALYRATLGREPEPEELRLAKRFVAQSGLSKATLPWQELAQALLLSNEFMFVD